MSAVAQVHFGGPDHPPRALRDLLEQRVDAVPPGGAIHWMTYYFRDQRLAEALVRAHQRGVAVRLCVEGQPRNRRANDRVIGCLRNVLGEGVRVVHRLLGASHLHTKLYCFSGPQPHALVGSFNPSGDDPEDPAVFADIGDQDRGHNLLVQIHDPTLVTGFVDQVAALHRAGSRPTPTLRGDGCEAHFFPRSGRNPLDRRLERLGEGATLRIAASHVRDPGVARQLGRLTARGAKVELLTHHTLRRSPERLVQRLRANGVRTWRYEHPDELPMHAKFMLAEDGNTRWSAFGSYNLTRTSRWLNQELLVFCDDPGLWQALDRRWNEITSEPWCLA